MLRQSYFSSLSNVFKIFKILFHSKLIPAFPATFQESNTTLVTSLDCFDFESQKSDPIAPQIIILVTSLSTFQTHLSTSSLPFLKNIFVF